MSMTNEPQNRVRTRRLSREWSQAELAQRAGISRAAVSAIEGERLVPSVATALALARVLDCSVEELFSTSPLDVATQSMNRWAWGDSNASSRYWCGSVQGRLLLYPAEITPLGAIPHDGVGAAESNPARLRRAETTLVMATCDPAAGLLARLYEHVTGYRLLVFLRSSRQALEMLEQGLIHLAGVHLAAVGHPGGNAKPVRELVSQPARLLKVATWQDGIAVGTGIGSRSVRGLLRSRVNWIGREPGSGARQCLDDVLDHRPSPRHIARDHRGVVDAIRCGWADAGVCLQLVAEEAGLRFLQVRTEEYDLCYLRSSEDDPRIIALVRVIQSAEYRRMLSELPGYDSRLAGGLSIIR